MTSRARQTKAEDGFILIEVLVSALILALVAGAVLALITATTHSAASERNRSVAYGLAQEDQARMRTMRLSILDNPEVTTREVSVGGTNYSVRSRARFVNNASGTHSCSSGNASTDYVEITSTVSSPTLLNPVSLHSIISPSNGSLDPSHGSLAIQATNGAGSPVSGVTATISGPSNASGSTEEEGCVIFADIPAGAYKLVTSANGLINREGQTSETLSSVSVPATGTQQISVYYDRAGAIQPKFVYLEPGQPEPQTAAIDSMMVYNSEGGKPASMYGSPGTYPPTSTLKVEKAFPFAATYAVYAGSCVKDVPEPSSSPALGNVKVEPGVTATPKIQVPALSLSALYNGNLVQGAKVVITDSQCPENGTKVKRTFYTDTKGFAALNAAAETRAVGVPYGVYSVCVSATISGAVRRGELSNLKVQNPSAATIESVALTGNSNTQVCA